MTIYTRRRDAFAEINEACSALFPGALPAWVAIGAAVLPNGANVELDPVVEV